MSLNILDNIDKIHTTKLGLIRIQRNISLSDQDIVEWCKKIITNSETRIARQGKNWYIQNTDITITVNAHSYTIITAHKGKKTSVCITLN